MKNLLDKTLNLITTKTIPCKVDYGFGYIKHPTGLLNATYRVTNFELENSHFEFEMYDTFDDGELNFEKLIGKFIVSNDYKNDCRIKID